MGIRNLLTTDLHENAQVVYFRNGLPRQSADWLAMTGFFDSLEEPPKGGSFLFYHFSGRVTVTVVPSPSRLVRDTVPW